MSADMDLIPDTKRSKRRGIFIFVVVLVSIIVYAFAFDTTDVNLDEIKSESRRAQLVRVLRQLARPEILTYERIDTNTDTHLYLPCPEGGFESPEASPDDRHLILEPACAEPGDDIVVKGFNFAPNARGQLEQVRPDGELSFRLDTFIADGNGDFEITVGTRERESTEPQWIRAVTKENVGSIFNRLEVTKTDEGTGDEVTVTSPRISEAATVTFDKIVETVFMAFLATSLGVLIAVPLSFAASRNLMRDVSTTVTQLALQIIALPIGVGAGIIVAGWARGASELLTDSAVFTVLGLIVVPIAVYAMAKWALPAVEDEPPTPRLRAARAAVLVVAGLGAVITLFLTSSLMTRVGNWLEPKLGGLDFIGSFVTGLGDILAAIITLLTALFTAGLLMSIAGRFALGMRQRTPKNVVRWLNFPLSAIAGAAVAIMIGRGIGWLYELGDPMKTTIVPGIVGAAIGALLAIRAFRRESVSIGLVLYYVARTIFNTLRSIEPLVMVIVFAVWVGIGAFAGSLALATHTIAALAKLYSEQVESISEGPIEAVKASGATRVQTIAYAVLPQVVPPYISFTLYRWDINVRMSTIIGFAGGGGIGFVLQQNIRFLSYEAASVNMLAIAIVVASMDYLSSRIRERIV